MLAEIRRAREIRGWFVMMKRLRVGVVATAVGGLLLASLALRLRLQAKTTTATFWLLWR